MSASLIDAPTSPRSADRRDAWLAMLLAAAVGLSAVIVTGVLRRALSHGLAGLAIRDGWLAIHLLTVIPAVPLGAIVLLRPKGTRLHRQLGRTWGMLMIAGALSSFALHGRNGGFSWIHLLAILVLVTVTRGIVHAVRGRIAEHRRTMTLVYAGLLIAGAFALTPDRLLGSWIAG
ncbi:DUF2306 domain-containing protein [Sphingomonas sp. MMS24-J13]|uniref:DUF2306 domain-containing protein n=1 Tax=Sphingomonas sp. MMS24-J13 TaxID=3238686 RepID=UPI00384FD993